MGSGFDAANADAGVSTCAGQTVSTIHRAGNCRARNDPGHQQTNRAGWFAGRAVCRAATVAEIAFAAGDNVYDWLHKWLLRLLPNNQRRGGGWLWSQQPGYT